MVLLSFSLRFCSAFKKHCNIRLKVKSRQKKRVSLHTCPYEKRFFQIDFEKTIVARTRVQSALALGTFTAVLQALSASGSILGPSGSLGVFSEIFLGISQQLSKTACAKQRRECTLAHRTAVRMRLFRTNSTNIAFSVIQALAFLPDSLQFRCGFIANSAFQAFR